MLLMRSFHRPTGFKDILRNPVWRDRAEEVRRSSACDVEAARAWSDEQVAQAVRGHLLEAPGGEDESAASRVLRYLGSRTHPAVLQILGDPALRSKLVTRTGTAPGQGAPFGRACELLGDKPPPQAVAEVASFLNDPSEAIRKEAAMVLGKIATPAAIPFIRKSFRDPDEYVRAYALMGLEYAVLDGRLGGEVGRELFPDVQLLLSEGKNSEDAARLLLHLHQQRATEFFLSGAFFTRGSPSLPETLEVLVEERVAVPRDRLLALITQLEAEKMEHPHTCSLGAALCLLGQHKIPEDRAFLLSRMAHAEGKVAQGAAAGLLASQGLEEFEGLLWKKQKERGYASLTLPQKRYSAVSELDGEINNGGWSQYFVNSAGAHWRDALAGLDAMGLAGRAAILREATAKFGTEGPSTERSVRLDHLARLVRKDENLFDALDDRWYKSPEDVRVAAVRYVLKNADAFR
jgi:HEAT repeat protein